MRKFFPRFCNVLCFVLALVMLLPISAILAGLKLPANVVETVQSYEWLKITYIPAVFVGISLLFFIISLIAKCTKKKGEEISKPLSNMAFAPLYFLGMVVCLYAALTFLTEGLFGGELNFYVYPWDFLGFGEYVLKVIGEGGFSYLMGVIFYGALFALQLILSISFRKHNKRNAVARIFTYIMFLLLAFVSLKGVTDCFSEPASLVDGLTPIYGKLVGGFLTIAGIEWFKTGLLYVFILVVALVLYIIIGAIRCKKNNAKKKEEEPVYADAIEVEEAPAQEPVVALPTPEEVLETVVEEKTIIKQVIYEDADLDQIFNTEFGFKNLSMVRKEASTEYYVNKEKFMSLSNGNKTMCFHLEIAKVVKLITKYPLVGKDSWENHKILFKIDDISLLNPEVVIEIIKDAYDTVLYRK